jgi:hypothetical protein
MQTEDIVIKMDQSRSSKILLIVFFLVIVFSFGLSYWRIAIMKNYNILASVDCDPYEERCFVHVCDPDPNVDGECEGDPEEDTWYTKNLHRKAYNTPECSYEDEECGALKCEAGEEGCFYELCGESNVPEGDACNDPEQYAKDNPIEEDASECEEDDAECAAGEEEEEAECEEGGEECAVSEAGAVCEEGDSECSVEESNEEESETDCDKEAGAVCPISEEKE